MILTSELLLKRPSIIRGFVRSRFRNLRNLCLLFQLSMHKTGRSCNKYNLALVVEGAALFRECEFDLDLEDIMVMEAIWLSIQRIETKWIIEQLIMQETFSREECYRLTELLKSPVIDWSMEAEKRFAAPPGKMIDNGYFG